MEVTVLIVVLIALIIFLFGVNIYDRKTAKEREADLIAALLSKNLSEYALAKTQLSTTTRDQIKKIKAENELALSAEALLKKDEGIPVT